MHTDASASPFSSLASSLHTRSTNSILFFVMAHQFSAMGPDKQMLLWEIAKYQHDQLMWFRGEPSQSSELVRGEPSQTKKKELLIRVKTTLLTRVLTTLILTQTFQMI